MTSKNYSASSRTPRLKSSASSEATLTSYQKFHVERVHRRDIKNAVYNPRVIDSHNKAKLRGILKKLGLREPLVWNAKTGNLISGHQRLSILDALEGSDNYLMDVSATDATPEEEIELNIAFNNRGIQGDFDTDKLEEILKTPNLRLDMTGFEKADLEAMFDSPELTSLFTPTTTAQQVIDDLEALQKKPSKPPKSPEERKAEVKRAKAEYKSALDQAINVETYAVVVFASQQEVEDFMEMMGCERDEKYVSGERVLGKIKRPG